MRQQDYQAGETIQMVERAMTVLDLVRAAGGPIGVRRSPGAAS